MNKTRATNGRARPRGVVLGLDAFEKISAVEGVRLTSEMKRDLRAFEDHGASAGERTRYIAGKYGKKSA